MRWNIKDKLLWRLWSAVVYRQTHGMFWFWGRKGREERFIQRLLLAYPALGEQPRSKLREVGERVLGSMRVGRITFFSTLAAFAAAIMVSAIIVELRVYDLRLPRPGAIALAAVAAGVASDLVRRSYIAKLIDRAIAKVFPLLFCDCGYCLIGLPDGERCPECGKPRQMPSNDALV